MGVYCAGFRLIKALVSEVFISLVKIDHGALFSIVFAKTTYENVLRGNPFLRYLNTIEK